MQSRTAKILYGLPRGLGILFSFFINLFALDVFNDGINWRAIGGFFIHFIPVYILVIVLLLAWHREWTSVIFYPLLAIAYILSMPGFPFSVYMIISGPLFLLAILFMIHRFYIKKNSAK